MEAKDILNYPERRKKPRGRDARKDFKSLRGLRRRAKIGGKHLMSWKLPTDWRVLRSNKWAVPINFEILFAEAIRTDGGASQTWPKSIFSTGEAVAWGAKPIVVQNVDTKWYNPGLPVDIDQGSYIERTYPNFTDRYTDLPTLKDEAEAEIEWIVVNDYSGRAINYRLQAQEFGKTAWETALDTYLGDIKTQYVNTRNDVRNAPDYATLTLIIDNWRSGYTYPPSTVRPPYVLPPTLKDI